MLHLTSKAATLKFFADAFLALVFPQACSICGAPVESYDDGTVCGQCWSDYEKTLSDTVGCVRCGWPARQAGPEPVPAAGCGQCRRLDLDLLRFAGPYGGALRAITLTLKRQPHIPGRARLLIEQRLLADLDLWRGHKVLAVPLHSRRVRERGFNQAEVLAREIARLVGLPLQLGALVRTIETRRHRAGMDSRERLVSVSRAFAVKSGVALKGCRVLLVDDVFTTGATMGECARVLREAGVSRVSGFTLSRVTE